MCVRTRWQDAAAIRPRPLIVTVLVLAAALAHRAPPADAQVMFGQSSPFNRRIDAARLDPGTPRAVASLLAAGQGININTGAWTPTVYHVDGSSPIATVQLENGTRMQIPMPRNAVGSNDADGAAEIIDRKRGCAYDFSHLARSGDNSWTAGGAAVFRLEGTGVHRPWAVRASGFSLGAGLIRPSEVRAGVIPHALLMAIPMTSPSFVAPATTSDGRDPNGLPMGSHLQLDPAFDLSVLPPDQRPIARAMQRYGVFVGDTSSSFALFAQNATSMYGFAYPASWSGGLSHARDILARLRLLKPARAGEIDSSPAKACRPARGRKKR
jgi:hypothetical protein